MTRPRWNLSWFDISVTCLVMGTVFYCLSRTEADPDLWGHIKFGKDLWQTGTVIRSDTYSYVTGDRLWINHEWLIDAIFYPIFAIAGPQGLIVLKVGVSLLITGLVYRHLCRQGVTPVLAGIVLLSVTVLLIPGLVTIRAQMFTYLFFLLTLLMTYRAECGHLRWLWAAPPMFILWANLHGGFLAGIGTLLIWTFVHFAVALLRARRLNALVSPSKLGILAAVLASGVATFVNPYGTELWGFLLRTATIPRPEITEWQPIVIATTRGLAYLIVLGVGVAGLLYSEKERNSALMALFVCASLLPLIAIRHLPLFALAVPVLTGEHLGGVWNMWSSARPRSGRVSSTQRLRPAVTGLFFFAASAMVWLALPHFRCVRFDPPVHGAYPVRAVALLKESGVSGNLAVHFDWGEYAIWHLGPRITVSMDGRRETVYSDETYRKNWNFYLGTGDWDALLREHETQLALISKKYPVFNLMRLKPGWLLVYEDPASALFIQKGWPLLDQIRKTEVPAIPYDGVGLCFP